MLVTRFGVKELVFMDDIFNFRPERAKKIARGIIEKGWKLALTFPNGHPQEREIGFFWFCNRYGPALVDRLLEDLPLDMGHHWILTV